MRCRLGQDVWDLRQLKVIGEKLIPAVAGL
jgi:hypothetical protein